MITQSLTNMLNFYFKMSLTRRSLTAVRLSCSCMCQVMLLCDMVLFFKKWTKWDQFQMFSFFTIWYTQLLHIHFCWGKNWSFEFESQSFALIQFFLTWHFLANMIYFISRNIVIAATKKIYLFIFLLPNKLYSQIQWYYEKYYCYYY